MVLKKRTVYCLVFGLFIFLFAVTVGSNLLHSDTQTDIITIDKSVVFEKDPHRKYPELEFEYYVVTLDAFVGDSGHMFHFPGNLRLQYDADLVQAGGEVALNFTYTPFDGSGKEYDLERGIKFNVDVTFYDWGIKYGNDIEGDFIPPMGDDPSSVSYDDELMRLWEKKIKCLAEASIGLYTVETFWGDEVLIPLRIMVPAGGESVFFLPDSLDYTELSFTAGGQTITKTIVIDQLYYSDIEIAAEEPKFVIEQIQSFIQPKFVFTIVDPKLLQIPPDPCNQADIINQKFPWFDGISEPRVIDLDSLESDTLLWELVNTTIPQTLASGRQRLEGIQDLFIKSYRTSDGPPVIGSPDTIVTVIRNVYGDISRGYDQIALDYYVCGATVPDGYVPIGSRILDAGSLELKRFNSGSADEIHIEFVYDETSINYVFSKGHRWNPTERYPRYIVTLTSKLSHPGESLDSWRFLRDSPSVPGNNKSIVSFDSPLPDFALDSLFVDSPNFLQYGDELFFSYRVTNRKESTFDTTYFDCRRQLESMDSEGEWILIHDDVMHVDTILPMDAGTCYIDSFVCSVGQYDMLPLDRAVFLFGVNVDTAVSEQDFRNNVMLAFFNVGAYPDYAYASGELYGPGAEIVPNLPDLYISSGGCDNVYIYVSSNPMEPPYRFMVDIGYGDLGTSPRGSSWNWIKCNYVKDIVDNKSRYFKVFSGRLCGLELIETYAYSYCFRVCIDNYFDNPLIKDYHRNYLYVDNTGACSQDGSDNAYYYERAGNLTFSSPRPMWNYRPRDLFQDNFPEDANLESWVRADMAADINDGELIIPGDSIVVECIPFMDSEITASNGHKDVFMHVKCTDKSTGKPPLSGEDLEGDYGDVRSEDGTWTVIQCEEVVIFGDSILADKYMFDLNDALFTRGYVIEYYFKASDDQGRSSTLPARAEEGDYFEFTCLPTYGSNILYVDDYSGMGAYGDKVQYYFDQSFNAVVPGGNLPDRYDVNDASALVSNGLGSRALATHLDTFSVIIWDSGDLYQGTICDGTVDKSIDCQVLIEWLDLPPDDYDRGLWILGNDVAMDMTLHAGPDALTLLNRCGVQLVNDSYYELTGGCLDPSNGVNPLIEGVISSGPVRDNYIFSLFGGGSMEEYPGCPTINAFDVLRNINGGYQALKYPDYNFTEYYASIFNAEESDYTIRTMWSGFSFMFIRDYDLEAPIMRNSLLRDVLDWFGIEVMASITGNETPSVCKLEQNFPNPFNPTTTIRFSIVEKGFVNIKIYNVAGQLVRMLVSDERDAGVYEVTWDGRNNRGSKIASGLYFCRMKTKNFEKIKKLVLLR